MQSRRAVPSDHALCVFVFVYLCLCVCVFVAGRCNLSGRCPPAMPCVGGGVYLGGVDLRHDDPHPPHSHTPRSAWTPLLCSMAQCCAWWECAVDTVFIITSWPEPRPSVRRKRTQLFLCNTCTYLCHCLYTRGCTIHAGWFIKPPPYNIWYYQTDTLEPGPSCLSVEVNRVN